MFEFYVIINRLLETFVVVRRIPSIQLFICFWTCTCPSAALNDIDISDIYKPCNKCACFCPVFFLHLGLIFIVTSKSGVKELMLVNQAIQDTTAIEKNIQLLSFKLKGTE